MTQAISLYFNCRILRGGELKREQLWIQDGRVIAPRSIREAKHTYDCRNRIISPGFLDLQVNGAFGIDFLLEKNKAESMKNVRKEMLATGCTGFCPTLITAPPALYAESFPIYKKVSSSTEGAAILGIHCEGPFINKEKKGAHPKELIRDFDNGWDSVVEVYGDNFEDVKIITLACEKENSTEVIKKLTERGVRVSLGHTMATLDDCDEAVIAGANKITHLFNAMPAFHHRDPSVPGILARSPENMFYGIIADGIHTHATAIRLAYRMHPEGMCLVTDAIGPMGRGEGEFILGTVPLVVLRPTPEDHPRAYVKGTTTLCGAIQPLDYCVRFAFKTLGIDAAKILEFATKHPAQCIGVYDRLGHLDVGADADFVILDDELNVLKTFCKGEEAYSAEGAINLLKHIHTVL